LSFRSGKVLCEIWNRRVFVARRITINEEILSLNTGKVKRQGIRNKNNFSVAFFIK